MAEIEIIAHDEPRWIENPETGEGAWAAWTEEGYAVLASGAIEGCGCGACESRKYDASYLGDADEQEGMPDESGPNYHRFL